MKKRVAALWLSVCMLVVCGISAFATDYTWVTEPKYDYIGLPGTTKAPYFTFESGENGGYLDENGNEVIGIFQADMTSASFYRYSDGNCYALLSENGTLVLLSPDGTRFSGAEAEAFLAENVIEPEEEMIELIYKSIEGEADAKKTVTYKNDQGENLFAPIEVWNAGEFHSGVAVIETEKNSFALTDEKGTILPQDVKLNLGGFYYEDLCIAEKDGKFGLVKLTTPHGISVRLNGKKIYFDQSPVIDSDRTLVPVRAIFEALGATVHWNGETRTVTAEKDGKVVSLVIDDVNAVIDGNHEVLDVPAKIIGGRTMVPVRFIAQSFGAVVDWDGANRTVVITMN